VARIVDIDQAPADAVAAIYAGELLGVRLAGAWSPAECAEAVRALDDAGLTQHALDGAGTLNTYGKMLAPSALEPCGPALDDYFASVDGDTEALEAMFGGGLRSRLAELLSRAAGGRPARVLDRPKPHRPATVRAIAPGAEATGHFDTYAASPSFAHLHELTDRALQLSFYLQLVVPERGGILEVAEVHREQGDAAQAAERRPVPLAIGDVILFDAANHFHRVTTVEGPIARLTVGGFAAASRDHEELYFWG